MQEDGAGEMRPAVEMRPVEREVEVEAEGGRTVVGGQAATAVEAGDDKKSKRQILVADIKLLITLQVCNRMEKFSKTEKKERRHLLCPRLTEFG